jgi:uncharacterized protein
MATDAIAIYKGQEFYVPYFEMKVGDEPLRRDVIRDITTVTYKDNIAEIDSFEITISNWDAEKRDFKYSDKDLFLPGKKVELWMGYYGKDRLRLMLTGEITSLRPSFPNAGNPVLAISGLNLLHRLRKKQESHAYINKTDTQMAREVAQRIDVHLITDPSAASREESYPYVLQQNQYDIIFLMERARRVGYDLFVIELGGSGSSQPGALYFGPSVNIKRTTYELKYGLSLMDFSPTLTTANQVGEVTVRAWDRVKAELIEEKATRSELSTHGVGKAGNQQAIEQSFNQRQEIVANRPVSSKTEAKRLALETLENISKDMVKATSSTVGVPDLRAGGIVMISGVGTRFSGRYFVTATTHTIGDSGYTTQFECRREELS